MRPPIPLLLFLIIVTFPLATVAQANKSGTLYTKDLSLTAPGTRTTYLELIHYVLPDLKVDPANAESGIAHSSVPFRNLLDTTQPAALEGDIKLDSFETRWINSEGKRVLLLELDVSSAAANQGTNFEGEAVILGAFSLEPQLKLLDVIDIKTDRFTSFWEKPDVLRLNNGNDAFLVYSTHWNSGESYEDLNVLFLKGTRFKVLTNLFLFNTQGCGATYTETPVFRVLPGSAKYPPIRVTVQVKKDADSSDCDRRTPGFTKVYRAVYQWIPARNEYRTSSRQLEALTRFNRDRL